MGPITRRSITLDNALAFAMRDSATRLHAMPDLHSAWDGLRAQIAALDTFTTCYIMHNDHGVKGLPEQQQIAAAIAGLLRSLADVSYCVGIDACEALVDTCRKFRRRYRLLERQVEDQGRSMQGRSFADLSLLWREAKRIIREGIEAEWQPRASIYDDLDPLEAPLAWCERDGLLAHNAGFAWSALEQVWAQFLSECEELAQACGLDTPVGQPQRTAAQEEIGDMLWMTAHIARHMGVSAEQALRNAYAE